jgi:hypothetical protein
MAIEATGKDSPTRDPYRPARVLQGCALGAAFGAARRVPQQIA